MHGNREVVERLKEHLKAHLNETEVEAFTIEDVHRVLSSFMKHYFASVANSSGTVGGFFLFGDGNDFPPGRKQQVVTQIAVFTGTVIERIASMYVLERAIWTDPVTGLVNRQCWLAKTEEELARARRMNLPVSVVLIDLDGFKAINDFLGHAKGDIVLRHVGSVLRKHVRRYDVVARLGGDEFAILLPATPPSGAMVVAERVRNLIESLDLSNVLGCATRLTASIGVATAPSAGETPEKLLEAADRALTTAKHLGKNRIVRDERSKENDEMAWAHISLMFDTRLMKWFVNRICHEINNPAQGILGIIELLLRRDEMTAEDVKDELLKVQNLVLRIRSVTHNLATASHADLVKYAQEFAETMRRISHEEDSEGDETAKEADA
jgi:diguanylate cyclase (GGDEF)-like protein